MPTLHSHTITNEFLIFSGVRECFAFAKSHQPTRKPKLGGSVCLSQPHDQNDRETSGRKEHRPANIHPSIRSAP